MTQPDLAIQTSLAQQGVPNASVKHANVANAMVRRAHQHKDLCLRFKSIPWKDVRIVSHCDAAFDRDAEGKAQGGFFTAFAEPQLRRGEKSRWRKATIPGKHCGSGSEDP